ncbi:MAG: NAD-dependent epimerase/dehydratase family protein [Streptosporangiaceae bacterium]
MTGRAARVLVTGAAGFIGGYLVGELLDRGYQVTGLDNLSKYGDLAPPGPGRARYEFVRGDARDPDLVASLLAGCEQFIAGAAMVGGIGYFHRRPYDLLAANERIIAAACDAAISAHRDGGLRKVTYLSSSMVYERADRWPSAEGQQLELPPPATSYGFSKLAVEYFARAAWDQYRLPFTIVRPFNCVGAGETPTAGEPAGGVTLATSHVVPDLVCRALAGQDPLRVLGSGDQLRHYTYGGDLARGIVTAMEHPDARNEDFNLSSDHGTTVTELARLIWRKVRGPDSPPRLAHEPPLPGDVQRRVPDTAKARRVLGFSATTTLEEMVDVVIAWAREARAAGLL